ncbi:MAG: ABC transporter permease [Chitinophagales bacterium]|nr:ABC transporter permease [Chitinophagales bacterium]
MQQLYANKLRSFLSLFGITVGIFSIIAILTAVTALKNDISGSINSLGNNLLFVEKWPWSFDFGEYPWWKYVNRPNASYKDAKLLEKRLDKASSVAFAVGSADAEIKFANKNVNNIYAVGATHPYGEAFSFKIEKGRYFAPGESENGNSVCILGGEITELLFEEGVNPIGQTIQVFDRKVEVVGTLKKEGGDLMGFSFDKNIIVPYQYMNKILDLDPERSNPQIIIKGKPDVTIDDMKGEIISVMRAVRTLRPKEQDDFAVNKLSVISQGFEGIFSALNIVGGFIGFLACLVGGFGIANIMYVSVSERTNIIGIKKAMGAKKSYILTEFLIESIILCLIGCIAGLALVHYGAKLATNISGIKFVLTPLNAFYGVALAILLGVLAGIIPALKAANLDPVEAIRSK